MALIEHVWPWTQQPQEVVGVNSTLPQPVEVWLPHLSAVGLLGGSAPTSDGAYSHIVTPDGVGTTWASGGRRYAPQGLIGGSARYAWVVVARRRAGDSSTMSVVRNNGSGVLVQEANNTVRCALWPGGNLQLLDYADSLYFTGYAERASVFAGRVDAGGAALYQAFLDGYKVVRESAWPSAIGAVPAPTHPLVLGATEAGDEVATLWAVLLVALWRDAAPDAQTMRALCANPWSMFAPRRTRIPVYSAAPSAVPTITSVGAENITSNSAGWRVSLDYA